MSLILSQNFIGKMERIVDVMAARVRSAKSPAEVRAAIALTDITGADVDATAEPMWWSMISDPILDTLIEQEIKHIYLEPMAPGGRRVGLISWARDTLRLTGTDHTGAEPTMTSKELVPKLMHSYVKIDEAALRAMMYRFSRQSFLSNRDVAIAAENALFIRTWVYSVLGSLVNIWWNGDTGGAAGYNMFDGFLKQVQTGGNADTTDSDDLLGVVLPNMWENAGLDQRHLDMEDICFYMGRMWAQRYKAEVLSDTRDVRGSYDPKTNELSYLNAKIVPVTDFPVTADGSNVLCVLTRRANLVAGIVDEPMTIDENFLLAGRFKEYSSPVQSNCVIPDTSVAVYWQPPA